MTRHPETELDPDDPGDDTFLRYRYQATYAAILSLRMMRPSAEIVEVFVEHHDDILLKMKSKRFNAVQVKTQQLGGPPFKSGDEPIRTALSKFISHDLKFGDLFERYTLATNHHFFRKDNTSSLFHLITLAQKATGHAPSEMDRGLSGFINSLLKKVNKGKRGTERATREHALMMMRKLYLDDSLPKLEEDIHQKLRTAIAQVNREYRAATYADLEQAANSLSHLAYMRSSKPVDGAAHLYVAFSSSPNTTKIDETIDGKRVRAAEIADALAKTLITSPVLSAADPIDPSVIPGDLSVAGKKMTAGGLSATTVAASQDWLASAQSLQRQWAMKYDEMPARERYNHVAVAVQTACSEAHEATTSETRQGPPMLEKLKEVLKRKRKEGTEFFDCEEEHLLGHATIRTDQCKVWWSEEFEIS
ncbi:DUF4297 domain-containing protein [Pirellulaceae bacterium]|nr:DUF4297 domain-containing protein [Pirellulaceae bacterium]